MSDETWLLIVAVASALFGYVLGMYHAGKIWVPLYMKHLIRAMRAEGKL